MYITEKKTTFHHCLSRVPTDAHVRDDHEERDVHVLVGILAVVMLDCARTETAAVLRQRCDLASEQAKL